MDKLSEQAARWFLRLQEDTASSQTFGEWQQWLNASDDHRARYEEIENTVLRLSRTGARPELPSEEEMAADEYDGMRSIAEWKRRDPSPLPLSHKGRGVRMKTYAMAAGVVLAVLSAGWLWLQQEHRPQHSAHFYETAPGERETMRLADGSRVTLDADSALEVRLTADRRSLILKRGEAYFQVARDSERPFIVSAGATRVTALGTAFNVRMSEDRTIVAVTEGKVELAAPRLTAQVTAGEAVSYVNSGNLQAIPAAEAPLATSWLEGRRQYRNEPLRYVLADVDRYTGQHIELGNEAAGELRFTGTLNLKNSEGWLRGLSVALPVTIAEKDDGVVVMLDEKKMPPP